ASAFRVVVIDLPAADGPVVEAALSRANVLIPVGRCETAGARGRGAPLSTWAAAGCHPDAVGAVVTGVRPRAPLAAREVRAALGDRLWAPVPPPPPGPPPPPRTASSSPTAMTSPPSRPW